MGRVFDIRVPTVLLLNIAFVYVLASLNSMLAAVSVTLVIPALFIVAPAVFLNFGACMCIIAVSAFLWGAHAPLREGLLPALWLAAGLLAYLARHRFRNPSYVGLVLIFQAVNLGLFVSYAVLFPFGEAAWQYALRLSADAFFSALALLIFVPFVVSFERSVFRLMGIDLENYGRLD